jgi:hypothetical protein
MPQSSIPKIVLNLCRITMVGKNSSMWIKASLLWEAFRGRLGHSEFSEMHIDSTSLLQPLNDPDDLIIPFTNEEIDTVVKNLKAISHQDLMDLTLTS